jgi:hypothetical protein
LTLSSAAPTMRDGDHTKGEQHEGVGPVRAGAGSRGRGVRLRHSGRREPRPARVAAHLQHQAHTHPARTRRRLHGRHLWPPHRQGRGLPRHARPGRHQLRHRGGLRPTRRDADDDDHRAEAGEGQQAGAFPDRRHRRHDEAADQVHQADRGFRQHSGAGARSLPPRRGRASRRHAPGAPGRHRRRTQRRDHHSQSAFAPAGGRRQGHRARGGGHRQRQAPAC